MKIFKTLSIVSVLVTVLFVSGCASKYDAEVMHQKGAHLTKLTRKAQLIVRHGATDGEDMEAELQAKYPKDMAEFSEYVLVMKNDNGIAVILMCDAKHTKALLEDAACTGALEGGLFFQEEKECVFHLKVDEICNDTHPVSGL